MTVSYMWKGIYICLMLVNMLFYSRRINRIIEKHNALPQQKQLQNKRRMWIYGSSDNHIDNRTNDSRRIIARISSKENDS